MSIYTIKRSFGQAGFEVSGPDKEWVEAKAEVLAGELETSPARKTSKRRTTVSSSTASPKTKTEPKAESLLKQKLDSDSIEQLVQYVAERQQAFDKTAPNQATIIAKFLKDRLEINGIDQKDLAYVYKQVGIWEMVNHRRQIENAADRNKYFNRSNGKFELNYAGEKFARDTARGKDG